MNVAGVVAGCVLDRDGEGDALADCNDAGRKGERRDGEITGVRCWITLHPRWVTLHPCWVTLHPCWGTAAPTVGNKSLESECDF